MSNLELIKKFRASLGLTPAPPITALPSTKILLKHSKDKFLEQILDDVPFWRRGLSLFQYNEMDKLYLFLRDDIYEGTSYRVKRFLYLIGLAKRFTSEEIKYYIEISEGDDVAFLWFLLLGKYGPPKPETITVEQQTIMTAIAHLNMIATLQELDRVLPKPHKRRKDPGLLKREVEIRRLTKSYQRGTKLNLGNESLKPYTQSQRLPLPYGETLILEKPPIKIKYNIKEKLAALKSVKKRQRWFQTHNYDIRTVFPLKKEYATEELIEPEVANHTAHCMKRYEEIKAVEQSLENRLQSIALKNCIQCQPEEHRQLLKEKLQEEVDFQMQEFRKYSEKYRLRPLINYLSRTCASNDPMTKNDVIVQNIKKELDELRFGEAQNTCAVENIESRSSQKLFFAAQKHKPYKFDYQKIFSLKRSKSEELLNVIKKELEECRIVANQRFSDNSDSSCSYEKEEVIPPPAPVIEEDYYDCNDLMLMHNMLRDSLEYLAQNSKLLLPAFPDAHKLIMLREFIVMRYGKRYTLSEQKDAINLALRAIKILTENFKLNHLPSYRHMNKYKHKTFAVEARVKNMYEKWHKRFAENIQNQVLTYTRNIWAGTRSVTLDIHTKIIFAYLPACPTDVQDLFPY